MEKVFQASVDCRMRRCLKTKQTKASKISRWARVLAAKSDKLSVIPRPNTVEGED